MNLLVIEPHADDAFLSLGYHLSTLWRGLHTCAIYTLFPETQQRAREAAAYAKHVGAVSYYRKQHLTETAPPTRAALQKDIATVINVFGAERVVGPLGIQHEQHLATAEALPPGSLRYLDTPYCAKIKNGDAVREMLLRKSIESFAIPPLSKFRACELFKSQAKFFYFNPPESLARSPEVVVQ
jgi:hypothetical protein